MPLRRVVRWGGGVAVWVGGPGPAGDGVPPHCPFPTPSRSSPGQAGRGRHLRRCLPWGLGLRRQQVPRAVAPVGEGVAQGPGEPVVGIQICDPEHRPSFKESRPRRLPVGPGRPNGRPEDPLVVLWGCPPPWGHLQVPPVHSEEHGIEGPVPQSPGGPQAGPAQPPVHLHHQGESPTPQVVWERVPVPDPGPGALCPPRRLHLRPLCLRRGRRALPPRGRGNGHPRRLCPRRGGGWLMLWSGGLGGDEVSGVGVDVVEVCVVVVVVVAVVRRHLLDTRGGCTAPAARPAAGVPAPRPPPFAPPSPRGSRAPFCLSSGAHGALALALGFPPGPHAFVSLSTPWVPPTVTRPLARSASARILPMPVPMPLAAPMLADRALLHSMRAVAARLGTLLALLRVLPAPLPFPCSLSRVLPSAACTLSLPAAAGLGALPTSSPSLLAAQACPMRLSLGTPPGASRPPLRAPAARALPRLRAIPPLPDHAPGVLLPP